MDQLTYGARNTTELKGQNHLSGWDRNRLSGWDSQTGLVLDTQPLLEITSGAEKPSLREEGVHTCS